MSVLGMLAAAGTVMPTRVRAQDTTRAPTQTIAGATLAGVIHDSRGAPIGGAEVVVRETGRTVCADSAGAFSLGGVAPGAYQVWFRHIGYVSTQYDWAARPGERTSLAVALHPVARTLDPVVVRAQEDKRMKSAATIVGFVVDTAGQPVAEAEVQLVGANRAGVTRANGGFAFVGLPVGTYVLRVRKFGYAPNVASVELEPAEEREVSLRLRALPVQLDPVVVNDGSGYGTSQQAWDDFDRRRRLHESTAFFYGPEDMKHYYSLPLDLMMQYAGPGGQAQLNTLRSPRPGTILGGIGGQRRTPPGADPARSVDHASESDCILVNGTESLYEPIRLFSANEIQMLEVYPSGTELSKTVAAKMAAPACRPIGDPLQHPTYYVIWLESAK